MHIHILGICGTFMGSLALLAQAQGHRVTGSDANVYPPMSEQLEQAGITLIQGYDPAQLKPAPDLTVVGNALSRGNPCIEYLLRNKLRYTSGPQWFGDYFLPGKSAIAVAGTHGKTTTTAMLAWILDYAGLHPGFLIGGVAEDFGISARLGNGQYFVVEADEYDTAFFDKRAKFVHYHPQIAILNNLEFDHADIYQNLSEIQTQFHHLIRTLPDNGLIVCPGADGNIRATLNGEFDPRFRAGREYCWTPIQYTGAGGDWQARLETEDGGSFWVSDKRNTGNQRKAQVRWNHSGDHNVANALASIAAAAHIGVDLDCACAALSCFTGVKRRMELIGEFGPLRVYDDFAHHPTAIATTLSGLRKKVSKQRILAVVEPRSNTMKLGAHSATDLIQALSPADQVFWYQASDMGWSFSATEAAAITVCDNIDNLLESCVNAVHAEPQTPTHIVIMSNGGFAGFPARLLQRLRGND